ncbi:hypothetical protein [Thermococcus sp. GR6]|uniref:hypothetical protein n=1 Tax=Thermococcus sp. GR6 TaxID=1638256 RepID=UPI001430DA1F|nr:hypothetical protein [Thermococcus sp. GR6]NJE41841.1 hypothetical protein [Thermococcus sp. GR6]
MYVHKTRASQILDDVFALADFLFEAADEFYNDEDTLTMYQFDRLSKQKFVFEENTFKAGDIFRCTHFAVKKRFYLEEVVKKKKEWRKAEEDIRRVRALALDNYLKEQLKKLEALASRRVFEYDKLIRIRYKNSVFVSEVDLFQPAEGWFIEIKNSSNTYHFDLLQLAFFSFSKQAKKLVIINVRDKSVREYGRDELADLRRELLIRFEMFLIALKKHNEFYAKLDFRFCRFCPLKKSCEYHKSEINSKIAFSLRKVTRQRGCCE